jgi:twitching motility protein PilT
MSDGESYGAMSPVSPYSPGFDEEPQGATATTAPPDGFGVPAPPAPMPIQQPMPAPLDSFAQLTGDLLSGVDASEEQAVEAGAPEPSKVAPHQTYEDPDGAVHDLLKAVLERRGSDLHLIAGTHPLLRINGDLVEALEWPKLTPKDVEAMVSSLLTETQQERLKVGMELDCAYSVPNSARFRVNIYWQRGSIAAAFRMIPYDIMSVDELGLPAAVRDLARLQRGLVLVTGPTGAGKSTTLAAMVDIVNRERRAHILTVEDPIEFLHKHNRSAVSQREVGPDTLGFAPALKHALRQDPDVIMVGEMRDLETISTAITAAETGHLVFATLHTQDAPQTIDRVIDVFPPSQQQQIRVQLAITLQGVVAQQLLPTVDGQARVVAAEVLVVTPAVRNLIREGKTHQIYSAMQAGRKFGMVTMDAALAGLVAEDKIAQSVAVQHAHNPEELGRLMGMPINSSTFGQ